MSEVKVTVIAVDGRKETLKESLELSLSDLRNKIPALMPPSAVFLDQDGSTPIRREREPRFVIADIVAAEPPYEVRLGRGPAAAGPDKAYEVRVNGKVVATLTDVATEGTLTDLRTRLSDELPAAARFRRTSGNEVPKGDEDKVRVKDVLAGTVINLEQPRERRVVEDRDMPDRPKPDTAGTIDSTVDDDVDDRTGDRLPSLDSAASQDLVPWSYMRPTDRKKVLDRFAPDFRHPLALGPNGLEPTWARVEWSEREFADLEPPTRLRRQSLVTFDRTAHEVLKVKTLEVNGDIGVPGLGSVSAGYSETVEEKNLANHSKFYLLDKLVIPKVALRVPREVVRVPDSFREGVAAAVRGDSVDACVRLVRLLNDFGYWVATAWVLGGTIYAEETVEINKTTSIRKESQAYSAAFTANLSSIGVPATVGGGVGHGTGETTTNTEEHHTRVEDLIAIGGDPATVGARGEYVASLSPYRSWVPVDYTELHPTLSLLDQSVQNRCVRLVESHSHRPDVRAMTRVDLRSYVKPLMAASLSDDW